MANPQPKPHLPYIDCVRGYAVLMVITCHVSYEFPGLPYPVHRLTSAGWFGVQLFFLASCLTLLLSWHSELRRNGATDVGAFFIRRFFRIAPAYYLAGVLYYFLMPPSGGFDALQMITSMLFINTWHPLWTTTVPTAWNVVPGGWSIGVEFSFYMVFPLFAAGVTNLRRALLVFAGSVAVGVLANNTAGAILDGSYTPVEIENFLFFWFPNQMSVFALGGVLFFLLRGIGASDK
jgi:peptidoglycan/LPS O-acetylase OafA/YrhL